MNINSHMYQSPSLEYIELHLEGSILSMSGSSIGVGNWDEDEEDYGGSAE